MKRWQQGLVPAGVVAAAMVAMATAASTAWAQDVHKCVVDGQVAFQSTPCPREDSDEVVHVTAAKPTAADAAAAAARVKADERIVAADKPEAKASMPRRARLAASAASAPQAIVHRRRRGASTPESS